MATAGTVSPRHLLAPRLRHRVDLQEFVPLQDSESGAVTDQWVSILTGSSSSSDSEETLPAEIVPMSGRELLAAAAVQAAVNTRITIRWRPDVVPSMRVVHEGLPYNIRAVLPDPTLRRWLTLMCESGVNNG